MPDYDVEQAREQLQDRVVLVTGAGGSVGSELCRQIARFRPARLLLLDQDENRLLASWLSLPAPPPARWDDLLLVDIRDLPALTDAVVPARPDVVIHAAALTDRDLLERYPREAYLTNVRGTRHVLEAATQAGVGLFVNISSHAAADQTCVLGQSEHLAEELTAQWAQQQMGRYLTIRFDDDRQPKRGFTVVPDICRRVLATTSTSLDGCVIDANAEVAPG